MCLVTAWALRFDCPTQPSKGNPFDYCRSDCFLTLTQTELLSLSRSSSRSSFLPWFVSHAPFKPLRRHHPFPAGPIPPHTVMSAQYSHIPLSEPDGESPDTSLTEQLVGPAPGAPTLRSEVVPRLSVVAPATLPEGYEFDTTIGSASYRVKVPPGGVEEGQTFDVPLPSAIIRGTTVSVPVGHWRDSLLGCFSHGPCHPHLWTGLLCGLCKWFRLMLVPLAP